MNFYPLLEEVRKGSEASSITKALLAEFPSKYSKHSRPYRIKARGNTSMKEFQSDVEKIVEDLGLEINNISILPPGKQDERALSDKYETLYITPSDSSRQPFGLIMTGMAGRGKTSTGFKEGLVCFFFSSESPYEPFNKRLGDAEENYLSLMESIYSEINRDGIKGVSDKDLKEIKDFLESQMVEYNSEILTSIFNSMAIGNWLRNSEFGEWIIDRDKLFTDLKKCGSEITKLPEDKWNPMDIVLIEEGYEDDVRETISEAKNQNSKKKKEKALSTLNRIFVNNIGSQDQDVFALAISLKEARSQHGRAKSYMDSLDVSDKTQYNLTEEEKSWYNNPEKVMDEIIKMRKDIEASYDPKIFEYKLEGDIEEFTGDNLLGKYGSLKMTKFFIDYAKEEPDIFANLASYGLSLGVNPTFFKLIGSNDGDSSQVKVEKFESQGGVVLYDIPDQNYDGKVWIVDKKRNSGIQLIYWVIFAGWSYYVQIQIRSSQGKNRVTQVDVEIEKFHKLKEI